MKKKGFTLIELLVVTSIIGVLAIIIIGSLGRARDKARDVSLLAEARELKNVIETFNLIEGRYPTPGDEIENGLYIARNCENELGLVPNRRRNWDDFLTDVSGYVPNDWDRDGTTSSIYCLTYVVPPHPGCNESTPEDYYSIIFATKDSQFSGVDQFAVSGSDSNYNCLYPLR